MEKRWNHGQQKTTAASAPLRQGIKHQQQDKAGLRPRQCIRIGAADARAAQPRGPGPGARWRTESDLRTLREAEQSRADRRRLRSATQMAAAEMGALQAVQQQNGAKA
jgi:hypothetical protein